MKAILEQYFIENGQLDLLSWGCLKWQKKQASFNDKDSSLHTVTSVVDHSTETTNKWRINLIHVRTALVHNPLGLLKITIYEA